MELVLKTLEVGVLSVHVKVKVTEYEAPPR